MAVIIGSARIDERGKAYGGAAGDQTGKEVSTQNWYLHAKGWVVIRPNDPKVAEKIATCMQWACDNNNIGYDQYQRLTLYNAAQAIGFNLKKLKTKVETDCSALVRVCLAYAGIMVGNFTTANEVSVLRATGKFDILTDAKYTTLSAYLKRGDILVTKTSGHTVVVLSNGSNASTDTSTNASTKLTVDGDFGPATVKVTQKYFGTTQDGVISNQPSENKQYLPNAIEGAWEFKEFGYDEGSDVIKKLQKKIGTTPDGWFGPESVKAFQKFLGVMRDGSMGPATVKAWQTWLNKQ